MTVRVLTAPVVIAWVGRPVALALLFVAGCGRGPEHTADRFVEAYFVEASQEAALELSAGLAAQKLREELALVASVRAGGYTAQKARSSVRARRRGVEQAAGVAQVRYDLTVESAGGEASRRALVVLRRASGAWRVTQWSLFEGSGTPPAAPPPKSGE